MRWPVKLGRSRRVSRPCPRRQPATPAVRGSPVPVAVSSSSDCTSRGDLRRRRRTPSGRRLAPPGGVPTPSGRSAQSRTIDRLSSAERHSTPNPVSGWWVVCFLDQSQVPEPAAQPGRQDHRDQKRGRPVGNPGADRSRRRDCRDTRARRRPPLRAHSRGGVVFQVVEVYSSRGFSAPRSLSASDPNPDDPGRRRPHGSRSRARRRLPSAF